MKAERIGLKRIGLQKIGLPRIGVMGAGASMRPTEIVGISYAREIGSIPSAMGNGLLTSEKWAKVSVLRGNSVVDGEQILSYQQWGESVVWNQLVKQLSPNANVYSGLTFKYDTKTRILTIDGTATITWYNAVIEAQTKANHVYIIFADKLSGTYVNNGTESFNFANGYPQIKIYPENQNKILTLRNSVDRATIGLKCNIGDVYNNYEVRITLIDLTLMFGEGNEPTTIEEFERRRPRNVTDEYNEGTEINGDIEIKTVGLNQWDEEWENGSISTSTGTNLSTPQIRSANYIPIIPNGVYKPIFQGAGTLWWLFFDKEKKLIKGASIDGVSSSENAFNIYNKQFKAPASAHFSRFYATSSYGSVYKNDICLHLVQDGLVSQYKPYTSTTTPLPNVTLIKDADGNQLFPYGLLSAGSVYDEITETKAIKRVGVVDMGALNWSAMTSSTNAVYMGSKGGVVAKMKESPTACILANILCSIYKTGPSTGLIAYGDKSVARNAVAGNDGYLYVYDTAYTNSDTFKAAMQGVLLYYELAEPIEVEIPKWKVEYKVEQGGTEQLVSENDTTNLKTDIIYGNKV